jgi:hypothetical protein|tara:strand:+ start:397 stop:630 length:234 start_codon:yes stop_codon:yes gene_type:complete
MNKAKLKKICVDAFEEFEKDAYEWTKEKYIIKIAQLLEKGLSPIAYNQGKDKMTKTSNALRSLFTESFKELKEKQND